MCILQPTPSSWAKPSPAGNRKPGLQLFSSISRVVHYIVQVALFFLESSFSFPLLWFFLPTELFQSPHLLLEVLMLIPRWRRKRSLLDFLEYLDIKDSSNCTIMQKPSKLFLTVKSILKLTGMYPVLLLVVILCWETEKTSSGTLRTNKVALFSNKWCVRNMYYFHCIYRSTVFKWAVK